MIKADAKTTFERYLARSDEFWKRHSRQVLRDVRRAILVDLMSDDFEYCVGNAFVAKYLQERIPSRLIGLLSVNPTAEQISLAESFGLDELLVDTYDFSYDAKMELPADLQHADASVQRRALLSFSYGGVVLGDLAYDTYLRATGMGTVERIDEDVLSYLRQTVAKYKHYRKIIRDNDVVATVQGHVVYNTFGALARAAIESGAVVYGRKFASGPFTIRRYRDLADVRNHEFKLLPREFERMWRNRRTEFCAEARAYIEQRFSGVAVNGETGNQEAYGTHKQRYEAAELRQMLGVDPGRPTACIMSHVFPDAPHSFPSMLYEDYFQWLVATLKIVKDIPDVNWLVKPHPDNKHYSAKHCAEQVVQGYLRDCPHIRVVPDTVNTASLFGLVDAIVTVSGTAGLEFSALGIPCIQAGESLYSGLGFTVEPDTVEDYAHALANVGTLGRLSNEKIERALLAVHLIFLRLRVRSTFLPTATQPFWVKRDLERVYEESLLALERERIQDDPVYRSFMVQLDSDAAHMMSIDVESSDKPRRMGSMQDFDDLGSDLIFLVSLPRSGSTLLQRILGAHTEVATLAEPWLMLHPLYALKREGVDAEYDANLARQALDDFLTQIDGGEEAYIQGIRRFASDLYARALVTQGKSLFLDKTPRYYRVLPLLRRVFPRAKFVFLLRNPLAVLSSTLHTWFEDDPGRLQGTTNHRDLLEGPTLMLEGIAELGEDAITVRYEDLVADPERVVAALCARLCLEFDPSMLEYGRQPPPPGRFGDNVGVPKHAQPTNAYCDKWTGHLAPHAAYACALEYLERLGDSTVKAFGYDAGVLQRTLEAARQQLHTERGSESPRVRAERINSEGESLYEQGDIQGAQACFEQARAVDPDFATAYNNLIVLSWEAGETERALNFLADGLCCAPTDRDLIVNGTQILRTLGLAEEAHNLCLRYLESHPDDATVHALLGTSESVAEEPVFAAPPTEEIWTVGGESLGTSTPGVITIATSIAPKGIEKQQRAVASWQGLGFRVVSLNTPAEIAALESHFPQIEFVAVHRHGKQLAGKPYVFLDDVLGYLRDASGSHICGIVNSDIILRAPCDLVDRLWREAKNTLVYGSRIDVRAAEDVEGSLYHRGFDFFFFDRAIIGRLPKTNFMLGVPWWDYWVPIGFQLAGVQIKRLDSRIAYHVWHSTNYSTAVLVKFGREFMGHCTSAPFTSLYTQAQDARFGDAAFSVLSDAALDYINRNTAKIKLPETTATEPASGMSPRVSAIVSTYKSASFIGECLEDLIGQTISDRIEIIVIDAASPEDEHSVVAEYQRRYPHIPIRYQRTKSRIGVYAAWNLAAQIAQGDYLITCSTNDRLRRDALEILARTLDERPDVALVYGNSFMTRKPHQRFESAELCSVYLWTDYRYEDLIDRCMVGPHPMWRRSVHEEIGYFDERYIALGDQEFWLRLGADRHLLNIPDFTGLYYVSEDSLTGNSDVAQRETDAVHALYQWRHRYPRWRRLADRRRPTNVLSDDLPAVHVLLLTPPGDLGRAADTLDALGVQNYPKLRVSIFADQDPPDPVLLQETGLDWRRYSLPVDLPQWLNETAADTPAEWLCLIDAGDSLANDALSDVMRYAQCHSEWQLIYTDDDVVLTDGGMRAPRFKPDFNLGLLRSQPYIGGCVFIRPHTVQTVGGFVAVSAWRGADLTLRVADRFAPEAVGHVPRVLVHYAGDGGRVWRDLSEENDYRHSVQFHLERRGLSAEILAGQTEGTLHTRLVRRDSPLVSIILHGGTFAERQLALRTLLLKTGYVNYEILVLGVDADSAPNLSALPQADRVRMLSVSDGVSSTALAAAAQAARGEYLLWLDGRCLVLHEDWIERLLAQAVEEDVGIVGARLVDRKKAVMDAGVILGLGTRTLGARVNVGLHMTSPGYLARAQCEQDLSAVTSLCMLVRKTAYVVAGGFAQDLTTGLYRDVDFCLKARACGWRVVWTPAVTLMFLGDNADADRPPKDLALLEVENRCVLDRWFPQIAREPAYNRNLSQLRPDYQVELNAVPNWDPVADHLPRILGYGTGSYGSWQYRAKQPLQALDAAGMAQCALTPFSDKKSVTLPTAIDIEHMQPHVLLLHNTLHDNYLKAIEEYRRYNRVSLVFGQDDLMFALPPKNPYSKTVYKDIKKRIRRCVELCDRVVVTTEPLADALHDFSPDIDIVPNYLPHGLWSALASHRGQGSKPRIGWAGAQQHGGDLELLYEVVKATAGEADWVFFGMCPDVLHPYVREIHKPVDFSDYPARLAALNLDLAVAPLEHNRFNEAKSNLRILEYGVLGWPVIASDIHPYREGPVFRVANNAQAWIRAIREHLADPEALARAGDNLKAWVRTHWMLEDNLDEWLAALRPNAAGEPVVPSRRKARRCGV